MKPTHYRGHNRVTLCGKDLKISRVIIRSTTDKTAVTCPACEQAITDNK